MEGALSFDMRQRDAPRLHQKRSWRSTAFFVVTGTAWLALAAYLTAVPNPSIGRRGLLSGSEGSSEVNSDTQRTLSDNPGQTVGALLLSLVVGVAATAAGVGGGAFYVPLFNIVLQFSVKGSMALSQAAIAGGALAGCCVYLFKQHPNDPTKHVIDFDLALMLTPPMLLGVAIGVLANILLPSWLITFLLIVLLVYLSYVTVQKAFKLHRAEKQSSTADTTASSEREREADPEAGNPNPEAPATPGGSREAAAAGQDRPSPASDGENPVRQGTEGYTSFELDTSASCVSAHERERPEEHVPTEDSRSEHDGEENAKPRFPFLQVIEMLLLWGAFLALQLEKSRFPRCSPHYIAMFASQGALLIACGMAFLGQAYLRYKEAASSQLRRPILPSIYKEIDWTMPRLVRTSLTTLIGGITAGLLGIGGGMILSPLLLFLGVHPLVGSATSSVLVLFSSSSAALSFLFDGTLNWQFALLFGLTSFGVALVGVIFVVALVKRSGKASIIVMLLAFIIFSGAVLTAAFAGRKAIMQLVKHDQLGFSSFCSRRTA